MDPHLSQALTEISEQLSMILAMLICIVVAVVRWKRHPRVSMLVIAGCLLLLFQTFIIAAVYAWVPDMIIKAANPANLESFRTNLYLVIALISNSFVALAFALLVTAIFMRRTERALS